MKKYIFATDVDGTMLMDNKEVHPETLFAFKRAKEEGHIVVIATGRSVVRTSSLKNKMPYVNYFVCNNGAVVYDVDKEEILILHGIEPKYYIDIFNYARKYNLVFKLHTDQDWIGDKENENENPTPLTKELDANIKKHIIAHPNDNKLFNGQTITQLSVHSQDDFCIKHFNEFKDMFSQNLSVYLTNSHYLDLNPKNRSKWEGLKELARALNISQNNIVTFGDSGNDYEMILGAGENGYAMANSHKDLTDKIKPKIGTNNTNAIGLKILEYLDKK